MTKEQIEQKIATAAEWYADDFNGREYDVAEDAFFDGADWALSHQWVSVEDELPEEDESVIVLTLDDEVILARFIDGEFMFNQLWNIEPTHWMPIPPLAEEGGEDGMR